MLEVVCFSQQPPEGAFCVPSTTAASGCLRSGLLQKDDYVTCYRTLSFDAEYDLYCTIMTVSWRRVVRSRCVTAILRVSVTFQASSPTCASFFGACELDKRSRLVEFTPDHAPSVQLVATLLMTSLPRASIGPERSHTGPIAKRWSDVSQHRVPFTLNGAGRGGEMIEAKWRRQVER